MDLKEHYTNLYNNSIKELQLENYKIDSIIQDPTDNRFGITLILRPSEAIKNKIQSFLEVLKKDNPAQYYYCNSDIHITLLSIISCYAGFTLNKIDLAKYSVVIQNCLQKIPEIEIEFKGVTASSEAIMIQGFPKSEALNNLRKALRSAFKNSGLQQTIDQRYIIATAHTTVVRYQSPIAKRMELIASLQKYRNHSFGIFKTNQIELVANDWYQKQEKVQLLHLFNLKK